jgi:hypothetical protein
MGLQGIDKYYFRLYNLRSNTLRYHEGGSRNVHIGAVVEGSAEAQGGVKKPALLSGPPRDSNQGRDSVPEKTKTGGIIANGERLGYGRKS